MYTIRQVNKNYLTSFCFPVTKAERMVYYFYHGKKFHPMPEHINCRCVLVDVPTESLE